VRPFRIAQVAAVRATVDVPEADLRAFAAAFSDDLDGWLVVGVPFSFDRLEVTTRLVGAHNGNRLRGLALDLDLFETALAEALEPLEAHPIEASLSVGRDPDALAVRARFLGPWTRWKAWEVLPRIGAGQDAAVAWDRAMGTLGVSEVLSVAVAVGPGEPRFEVEAERVVGRADITAQTAQLAWAAKGLGIGEAGRLASLVEGLCARDRNSSPVTWSLGGGRLLPTLRVTVPSVPVPLVLQLMEGLGAAKGYATRLGAIMGAMGVNDDLVWRLHLEATADGRVVGAVEIPGK